MVSLHSDTEMMRYQVQDTCSLDCFIGAPIYSADQKGLTKGNNGKEGEKTRVGDDV